MADSSHSSTPVLIYRELDRNDFHALNILGPTCFPLDYPDSFWKGICDNESNMYYRLGVFDLHENMIGFISIVVDMQEHYYVKAMREMEKQLVMSFPKVSYISIVGVHKEWRKKGLGQDLVTRALKHVHSKGSCLVYLHVLSTNEGAINLYKKLDFKLEGEAENYYLMPNGERKPALVFSKLLTPSRRCQFCQCTVPNCVLL